MNAPLKRSLPTDTPSRVAVRLPVVAEPTWQWSRARLRRFCITLCLLFILIATAVTVIWSVQATREAYLQLESLKAQAQHLDAEWVRLLLEESTLASPHLIEQAAADELGLVIPDPLDVQVLP